MTIITPCKLKNKRTPSINCFPNSAWDARVHNLISSNHSFCCRRFTSVSFTFFVLKRMRAPNDQSQPNTL